MLLVPNDGCLNFVDENDEVLLAGFGRKGKAKGDIPGVRFKGWSTSHLPAVCLFGSLTPRSGQGFWCRSARSLEGEEGEAEIINSGLTENGTVRDEESAWLCYIGIPDPGWGNLGINGRHGLSNKRSLSRNSGPLVFGNGVLCLDYGPAPASGLRLHEGSMVYDISHKTQYITPRPRPLPGHISPSNRPPTPG